MSYYAVQWAADIILQNFLLLWTSIEKFSLWIIPKNEITFEQLSTAWTPYRFKLWQVYRQDAARKLFCDMEYHKIHLCCCHCHMLVDSSLQMVFLKLSQIKPAIDFLYFFFYKLKSFSFHNLHSHFSASSCITEHGQFSSMLGVVHNDWKYFVVSCSFMIALDTAFVNFGFLFVMVYETNLVLHRLGFKS